MNALILGMLAETGIHVGGSQGAGVVDLPVAREGGTDYPFVPGSGMKGALRDAAQDSDERGTLFGTQERAGALLIGDARLVLLPIRSLTGTYRWATCPHLLERYRRDLARTGRTPGKDTVAPPPNGSALGASEETLFLEEREVAVAQSNEIAGVVEQLGILIADESARSRLEQRIVILTDDDFAWFARFGLPIQARNVLEEGTKQSKNLWYEESLPMDTVMYSVIGARTDGVLDKLRELFTIVGPYLQVGANETVGQGWFLTAIGDSPTNGETGP